MFSKPSSLYSNPNIVYLPDNQMAFDEYISYSETLIRFYHSYFNAPLDQIVSALSPYQLGSAPAKTGILLIHGLLDSPFTLKDLAMELNKNDVLLRSVLLPGHAAIPGALLDIQANLWREVFNYGVETLKKEVKKIVLVGYSTGANLALDYAIKHPDSVEAVVVLAPALKINSIFNFLTPLLSNVTKKTNTCRWFTKSAENDFARYASIPFDAINEVYKLGNDVCANLMSKQLSCPVFMSVVAKDEVVSARRCLEIFELQKNPLNRLLLYTNKPHTIDDTRVMQRKCFFKEERVEDFSHLGLPIAPTNFHYGEQGAFKLNHEYEWFSHLDTKNMLSNLTLGPIGIKPVYKRLTFNPDFAFFSQTIKNFLDVH